MLCSYQSDHSVSLHVFPLLVAFDNKFREVPVDRKCHKKIQTGGSNRTLSQVGNPHAWPKRICLHTLHRARFFCEICSSPFGLAHVSRPQILAVKSQHEFAKSLPLPSAKAPVFDGKTLQFGKIDACAKTIEHKT